MDNQAHNQIVSFIWGIADDCLRDVYVRGKYRDVILPMTVIRRLDAMLEGTKQAVLDMKKINNRWADVAKELGVDVQTLRQLRHGIAGPDGNFCNDSPCGASDDSYCRGPRPGGPCGGPDDCGGPRS